MNEPKEATICPIIKSNEYDWVIVSEQINIIPIEHLETYYLNYKN